MNKKKYIPPTWEVVSLDTDGNLMLVALSGNTGAESNSINYAGSASEHNVDEADVNQNKWDIW